MTNDRVNILLVDDQPSNLLALESILADSGENLVSASSGTQALKYLLQMDFAVVLLDVQMPDLDGFETADLIRQRDRSRDTPIIFLTALSRSETNVFRGYELGAVDYIFKPFHPDILKSKVNVFVELFRRREEFKAQAQELARLARKTELILKAAVEGIFGVGLNGTTSFVNPAALRMIGRSAAEVSGSDMHSLVHPIFPRVATCDPSRCRLHQIVHGDPSYEQVEDTFFRADGSSFPVEFSASPMRDDTGDHLGSVITFRDITERRAAAATAEAERRYREAEAENRAKDNFLATLSHELRTPMTSILGWVQFLRTGAYDPDELEEALRTIESSGRLQARLIDDMLDVSRMVLGKFQIDLRPTRIAEIVESALTSARPLAQASDVRLKWDIEDRDAVIDADPNRIEQVIHNLLSNAIKFSPRDRTVDLRLYRTDDQLRISVEDQGEGIDPAFLPHVFDRLRQSEASNNRSGLGLGLAIARHIVELHHGEITAESDGLGHGSRFTVSLPVAAGSEDSVTGDDEEASEPLSRHGSASMRGMASSLSSPSAGQAQFRE